MGIWASFLAQAYRGLRYNVSRWYLVNLNATEDMYDFQGFMRGSPPLLPVAPLQRDPLLVEHSNPTRQ